MSILSTSEAPDDPIERLLWLSGAAEAAKAEIEDAFAKAYFEARLSGRLDAAVGLGLHSKSTVLRLTRRENNASQRMVRWGDGADATSSAYGRPTGHSQ
jgi:hypothetical protein